MFCFDRDKKTTDYTSTRVLTHDPLTTGICIRCINRPIFPLRFVHMTRGVELQRPKDRPCSPLRGYTYIIPATLPLVIYSTIPFPCKMYAPLSLSPPASPYIISKCLAHSPSAKTHSRFVSLVPPSPHVQTSWHKTPPTLGCSCFKMFQISRILPEIEICGHVNVWLTPITQACGYAIESVSQPAQG